MYDEQMIQYLKSRLNEMHLQHSTLMTDIRTMRTKVASATIDTACLTDMHQLLKELSELHEDTRKELDALKEDAGDSAAIAWTVDPMAGGPIRGKLADGTVRQRPSPKLPSKKKEPEKHLALMRYLMQAPDMSMEDAELFTLSWPRLCDRLQADISSGRPLPEGISADDLQLKPKLETRRCKQQA
jgi:hypothetical protein